MLKDETLLMEYQGKPVGYSHAQHFKCSDGYSYIIDDSVKQSIVGSVPYQVSRRYNLIVDNDYKAKSFSMLLEVNGTQYRNSATFSCDSHGTSVDATFTGAGGKEVKSFWRHDRPIYFISSLIDELISEQPISTEQATSALVWDLENLCVVDVNLKSTDGSEQYKGQSITGYKLMLSLPNEKSMELFVDAKGNTYWQKTASSNITYRRIDNDELPELEPLEADALVVPGNIPVSRPFISTESVVKVKWSDVPYNIFNLEDNRQKLIKHASNIEDNRSLEVIVRINRDTSDYTGAVKLPITDDSVQQYLHDDDLITPSLPEIQGLAREVMGNENDGWKVCQKLVSWVCNYICVSMIPETLTTSQILDRKAGKCSEYAILFAAMARAAGLPTRIALGERYQGSSWVGHMWNEVWLGRWIAIDASHNQVNPDALLLKLVHSSDVQGTQTVRMGLIGKLGIAIEKVFAPESAQLDSLKTGVRDGIYSNRIYRCRFTIPEDWSVEETEASGSPMISMKHPEFEDIAIYVVLFNIPQGFPAEQILNGRIDAISKTLPGYQFDTKGSRILGNNPAAYGKWTYENGKNIQENWILIDEDRGYLFVFMASAEHWDNVVLEFTAFRDSFQHL